MVSGALNKNSRGRGRTDEFPRLLGGRLCLHFANTVEAPRSQHSVDFLHSYTDLARWGWHVGLHDETEADRLIRRSKREPESAVALFDRALVLREAIGNLFASIARSQMPDRRDLESVWREHAVSVANARLIPNNGGYDWSWRYARPELSSVLWPVARSAVELLTEDDLKRVKECAGAGDCGWLFYDESRNGNRRWCSMEGCGSRVKMRAYYSRVRGNRQPSG